MEGQARLTIRNIFLATVNERPRSEQDLLQGCPFHAESALAVDRRVSDP